MKHKLLIISILVASALLCTACKKKVSYLQSKDAKQENIFQYYKVSYNANDKQLTAMASFTMDNQTGEAIKLTDDSQVLFNDQTMDMNINETKCSYQLSITGECPQQICFKYINNDDSTFLNQLKISKLVVKNTNFTIQREQGIVIPFTGPKLEQFESVVCRLSNTNSEAVEIETSVEDNRIIIYPEFLDGVQSGTYTGFFVRKNYCMDISAMDRGGFWESEYISTKNQITIK